MKVHYYVWAGGIFSLFVQGILQNHSRISGKEFYFEASMRENFFQPGKEYIKNNQLKHEDVSKFEMCNPFDFVLDQNLENVDKRIELTAIRNFYSKGRNLSKDPLLSKYHNLYKTIFNWTDEVLDEFEKIDKIIDNKYYLGVHCRFTTMNFYNGKIPLEAFSKFIDAELNKDIGIIVVSDNNESLARLLDKYSNYDVIYNKDQTTRFERQNDEINKIQTQDFSNFFKKEYWINGLKEAYLLSKANKVIKRASNLNTMAMIMRGTPQEEIYVPGSL